MSYLAGDARAFVAAVRKELRQIRRYPTALFGLVFWPLLLPSVYVLMGSVYSGGDPRAMAAFEARSGVASIAGFVFVGFSMYMWLSFLLWGPGTALRLEQVRGSLEAVYLTPVSRLVILFGPPVAQLYTTVLMFLIMAVGLRVFFGVEMAPDAVARTIVVIAVAVPAMFALASLFAAAVLRYGEIGPSVQFVRGILVLACGVSFPVVMLPGWAQALAAALPPTYIVGDMRLVLLGGASLADVGRDLLLLVGMAALTVVLGVVLYGWIERGARHSGMLGRY